jgi:hypothetical protein
VAQLCSARVQHLEALEVTAIEAPVPREQSVGRPRSVGSDQEIRDYSAAGSTGAAVCGPRGPRCQRRRLRDAREAHSQSSQRLLRNHLAWKGRGDLRPHNLASDQPSVSKTVAQSLPRPFAELRIRPEDVDQDVGVDRCDQLASGLPRRLSISSSVPPGTWSTPNSSSTGLRIATL